MHQSLGIVIPVLDDDEALTGLLSDLGAWVGDVVVVDGRASAQTRQLVLRSGARYLTAQGGRGCQIAAGFKQLQTRWLWILHADTVLSAAACDEMERIVSGAPKWGRFNVDIPTLPVIAAMMNWRSRFTHICTGDQGMFVHADLLDKCGGLPAIPLMEDIELSKRLKRHCDDAFYPAAATLETSPRRWHRDGISRTVLRMWTYRLRYYFGAEPHALYRAYYRDR